MATRSIIAGALRHEFHMQIRRRAIWIVTAFLGLLVFLVWYGTGSDYLTGFYLHDRRPAPDAVLINGRLWQPPSATTAVFSWAVLAAMFLPLAVGLLTADRLVRDRQSRVDELFQTLPGGPGARLVGKYLGVTLATLVPLLVVYALGVGYMLTQRPDGHALALAAVAFPVLLLPSGFFVAAYSLAVPLIMKVPLYQFLFIGYWFWGNLLSPVYGIPTLSNTILTPLGGVSADALFGVDWPMTADATPMHAALSIALLLALAAAALVAAWRYLEWRRARA